MVRPPSGATSATLVVRRSSSVHHFGLVIARRLLAIIAIIILSASNQYTTFGATVRRKAMKATKKSSWSSSSKKKNGGGTDNFFCSRFQQLSCTQVPTQSVVELFLDIGPDRKSGFDLSNTEMAVFNGELYFRANDGDSGNELWKTDGTGVNGTPVLIKDIGAAQDDSDPSWLTVGPKREVLFFTANDGEHGTELWKTDGTETGTVLVKDIYNGSLSSIPSSLTKLDGEVFFSANDGEHGRELWKTDGTDTVLVKDINPGDAGSEASSFSSEFKEKVFFQAYTVDRGFELWETNGTPLGTVLSKDINNETGIASGPQSFTEFKGELYFQANDGVHGEELWKTNGIDDPVLVKDINDGQSGSLPFSLTVVNNKLFFSANDGVHGRELWKTDGTKTGTVLVTNINPGNDTGRPDDSNPKFLAEFNGELYFQADDGVHGLELWFSDGTDEGTVLAADIWPGPDSSDPSNLILFDGTLYFQADDGENGRELWRLTV